MYKRQQLCLRNARAKVPYPNHLLLALSGNGSDNALAGTAVFGSIVQHIAEYLFEPLRIAGDGRQKVLRRLIFQLNTRCV